MRKCELCNSVARMYCESDRAILCWDCDARVHAANFLVAKHSRTLLCHACQAPTPWTGSGSRLGPTVSVCETCVHTGNRKDDDTNNDDSEDDDDILETEDEDEDNDDDSGDANNDGGGGGEDEGNDQVVPLSFTPPPLVSSSSSSQESSGRLQRDDSIIGFFS
ncbi:Zinc finger protein like [Actinidia chinensis var. chinensis]|uniref:Zinc finger protein like n=1 Tax=Actinidia chinensis var. chinensis TaxID=1590841 RepID=A0A2R6QLM6_ACTCC|nr:Zinc finger protein like [Actinidia chinensis var. chinensis]